MSTFSSSDQIGSSEDGIAQEKLLATAQGFEFNAQAKEAEEQLAYLSRYPETGYQAVFGLMTGLPFLFNSLRRVYWNYKVQRYQDLAQELLPND